MPFGEELGSGVGGRTTGMGFVVNDGVRQKFTSKERDLDTGLDYFGARYYSSSQGRFTGPDPLYIEMKRLPYPQAWNLYTYTRNNPVKYIDDTGLEIAMKCKIDEECKKTVDELNGRKGGQFKTELNEGKLRVVGEVDAKSLSKSERALYNAITSTERTATLEVVSSSDAVHFGYSALNNQKPVTGLNLIDRSDLNELNKVDSALSGEIVAHEAMEAWGSAGGLSNYQLAHVWANQFFGQIDTLSSETLPTGAAIATSSRSVYNFSRSGTKVTVDRIFVTPLPAETVRNNWDRITGTIKVIPPNSGP
jgi:RHS repeat-associated protein